MKLLFSFALFLAFSIQAVAVDTMSMMHAGGKIPTGGGSCTGTLDLSTGCIIPGLGP
jgi:hypothetical protein